MELMKINYENENPTVSGRELHEVLEVKSKFVLKRYNQIKSTQGTESAEKWLDMLARNVQVEHA